MQPQDPRKSPAASTPQQYEGDLPSLEQDPSIWSELQKPTTLVVVITAGLVGLLAIVVGIASLRGPSSASAPQVSVSTGPTATPVPQTVGDTATVGGTWGGFETAYGPLPDSANRTTWAAQLGGQPVLVTAHFASPNDAADGQERVAIVSIDPPPDLLGQETWDPAAAEGFASMFLPADAKATGTETGPQGATVYDYISPLLADTFASYAATIFTNDTGTRVVAPGSLHLVCRALWAKGSSRPDDCVISVGSYN